jgi:hypothetical protein
MQYKGKHGNKLGIETRKPHEIEVVPLLTWWRSAERASSSSRLAAASLTRIRKLHSLLIELTSAGHVSNETATSRKMDTEATRKCFTVRRRANQLLRRYSGVPQLLNIVPLPLWRLEPNSLGFCAKYETELFPGSGLFAPHSISEADAAIALLNLAKHGNAPAIRFCDWCNAPIYARKSSDRFCKGSSCRDSFHQHRDDRREEKRLAMKRLRTLRKKNPNLK